MRFNLIARWLMAVLFIAAGSFHFVNPAFFLAIMPPALPWHLQLVYISGVFELMGGIGLLLPATRRFAVYGLLALLIAVFPANIYSAVACVSAAPDLPCWVYWARLPLQLPMLWLVWKAR